MVRGQARHSQTIPGQDVFFLGGDPKTRRNQHLEPENTSLRHRARQSSPSRFSTKHLPRSAGGGMIHEPLHGGNLAQSGRVFARAGESSNAAMRLWPKRTVYEEPPK